METVGNRITKAREVLNMKQKELAVKAGIPKSSLSRFENNIREPKSQALVKLSSALGVSVDYLLGTETRRDIYNDVKNSSLEECIDLKDVGRRIFKSRTESGLTQGELANLLDTTKISISRYEAGTREIRIGTLVKLSKILNTSIHYLLGLEEPKPDPRLCDINNLPDEAINKVNEYIELLKLKYNNKIQPK